MFLRSLDGQLLFPFQQLLDLLAVISQIALSRDLLQFSGDF